MQSEQKIRLEKATVIIILALLISAAGGYYLYAHRIVAYRFAGNITQVAGDTVNLQGVFQNDQQPAAGSRTFDVQVVITPQTAFTKVSYQMPTEEELKKTNGAFSFADLKQTSSSGSLEDMISSGVSGMIIQNKANIYGQSKFSADQITYYDSSFSP